MRDDYVAAYERLEREHWWWAARRGFLAETLAPLCAAGAGRPRVLDAGCGAGFTLKALRGRYDCRGLEPDARLAQAARANAGVPVALGSLDDGGVEGAPFDAVLLMDVIEHIDDDVAALRRAAALARRGGWVVVNVPAMRWLWSAHDVVNEHKRRYEKRDLSLALARAGLEVRTVRYWGVGLALAARLARPARAEGYAVGVPPPWACRALEAALRAEWSLTRLTGAPFGLSLMAVGVVPA